MPRLKLGSRYGGIGICFKCGKRRFLPSKGIHRVSLCRSCHRPRFCSTCVREGVAKHKRITRHPARVVLSSAVVPWDER
jgi:hypothetical protein